MTVESNPIRSSCFQFEFDGIQPMLYAKNDFHIRFYDASYRITEATKQYVDYQVSRKVETDELLDLSISKSFVKPLDTDIKWFKVEATLGDSLAFKVDQACTIQLF